MFNKGLISCLTFLFTWLSVNPSWSRPVLQTTVNAVLRDQSYYQRYGTFPDAQTSEQLRIQTHLLYVEKLLKSHVPKSIPAKLYPRRQQMLKLLKQYIHNDIFPSQQAYRGRRPHFIDEQGRLCAVGYLIEQTAGLPLAQKINKHYSYAYLPEMHLPELTTWVKTSGLTLQELAMIQPTYDYARQGAREFFGFSFLILGLIQYALIAVHSGLIYKVETDNSFSKSYADIQTGDIILTSASIGLIIVMGVLSPFLAPSDSVVGMVTGLSSGLVLITGSVLNGLLLYQLDYLTHQNNQVSIGFFDTPDRQMSWGLHASLNF